MDRREYLCNVSAKYLQEMSKSTNYKSYSLFPVKDQEAFEFYKRQEAAIWSASELDFSRDLEDFESLEENQKNFLLSVLSFFASGDGVVTKNLATRFLLESTQFEETAFYLAQSFIEIVHAETYSLIIASLVRDEKLREELFRAGEANPAVKRKEEWMEKFVFGSSYPKLHRLVAFACAEGIFFSGAFSVIFWFGSKKILQNLVFSNVQISKDEALHCEFAVNRILKHMDKEQDKEDVLQIIKEATHLEICFMNTILPDEGLDEYMNKTNMSKYICFVANFLCSQLNLPPCFPEIVDNPFPFVTALGMMEKGNFFEVRSGNYKRFSVKDAMQKATRNYNDDKEEDEDPFL